MKQSDKGATNPSRERSPVYPRNQKTPDNLPTEEVPRSHGFAVLETER